MKSSDLNESIFWRTVRRIFTQIAEYGWNFLHSVLTCVMFPIFLNNFDWWIPSTKLKGWVKELITLMKYNKVSWTSHQHSTVTPSSTVLDFVASSLLFTQKIVAIQAYVCKIFVTRKKTISPGLKPTHNRGHQLFATLLETFNDAKKYMTLNLYSCRCNREACVDLLPILYTGCIESVFCIHPQITVSVNVTIMLKPTYQIPKKKGSVAPITYTKGCYSRFHPPPHPQSCSVIMSHMMASVLTRPQPCGIPARKTEMAH